jgi:hypothetical protein
MERVRRKPAGADDGNRQMVDILTAVLTDELPAVEAVEKLYLLRPFLETQRFEDLEFLALGSLT